MQHVIPNLHVDSVKATRTTEEQQNHSQRRYDAGDDDNDDGLNS
jgi:hypothetical protein